MKITKEIREYVNSAIFMRFEKYRHEINGEIDSLLSTCDKNTVKAINQIIDNANIEIRKVIGDAGFVIEPNTRQRLGGEIPVTNNINIRNLVREKDVGKLNELYAKRSYYNSYDSSIAKKILAKLSVVKDFEDIEKLIDEECIRK